jgi:hypothetical protein
MKPFGCAQGRLFGRSAGSEFPNALTHSTLILTDIRQDDTQCLIMARLLQSRSLEFFDQLPECALLSQSRPSRCF